MNLLLSQAYKTILSNNYKTLIVNASTETTVFLNIKRQNSYSTSHLVGRVTTQWLDGDNVVTVDTCW